MSWVITVSILSALSLQVICHQVPSETYHNQYNPYSFGYDVEDNLGNKQWRQEKSQNPMEVSGSYGYRDVDGIYREVVYIADKDGFRANVKTNEPGVAGTKSPADVNMGTYYTGQSTETVDPVLQPALDHTRYSHPDHKYKPQQESHHGSNQRSNTEPNHYSDYGHNHGHDNEYNHKSNQAIDNGPNYGSNKGRDPATGYGASHGFSDGHEHGAGHGSSHEHGHGHDYGSSYGHGHESNYRPNYGPNHEHDHEPSYGSNQGPQYGPHYDDSAHD